MTPVIYFLRYSLFWEVNFLNGELGSCKDRCECWRTKNKSHVHEQSYIPPPLMPSILLCSVSKGAAAVAARPFSNPAAAGSLNYATTPVECCSDVRTNFLHYVLLFWLMASPSACLSVDDCTGERLGRARVCGGVGNAGPCLYSACPYRSVSPPVAPYSGSLPIGTHQPVV